ncbi:MAG: hypothetical protein AB2A00_00920 [Myxococcota bacterium]
MAREAWQGREEGMNADRDEDFEDGPDADRAAAGSRTLKSIRLPTHLVQAAERQAKHLGIGFGDVVGDALASWLGHPREPRTMLLAELASLLRTAFYDECPPDVVRRLYLEIQNTPQLWDLYTAAISERGRPDEKRRESLHIAIGRMVPRVLEAFPDGRVATAEETELIRGYPLLFRTRVNKV